MLKALLGPMAVCSSLVRHGARLADPGEFTKRAFLNGRLDLTQAEAVLDTIRAKTAGALALAQAQLRGALSEPLAELRDSLIGLLAHVEAAIDFAEEDLSFIAPEALRIRLEAAYGQVERLAATAEGGHILREGITVVIAGRPNVGKSSLLNALLQHDRAIVTTIPGTTRDILEEMLNIRGIPMRLLDTAGLRPTDDLVEQEGVRRTQSAIEHGDLVLLLLDGSSALTPGDRTVIAATSSIDTVTGVARRSSKIWISGGTRFTSRSRTGSTTSTSAPWCVRPTHSSPRRCTSWADGGGTGGARW
jgi:tRNA modification GTPase